MMQHFAQATKAAAKRKVRSAKQKSQFLVPLQWGNSPKFLCHSLNLFCCKLGARHIVSCGLPTIPGSWYCLKWRNFKMVLDISSLDCGISVGDGFGWLALHTQTLTPVIQKRSHIEKRKPTWRKQCNASSQRNDMPWTLCMSLFHQFQPFQKPHWAEFQTVNATISISISSTRAAKPELLGLTNWQTARRAFSCYKLTHRSTRTEFRTRQNLLQLQQLQHLQVVPGSQNELKGWGKVCQVCHAPGWERWCKVSHLRPSGCFTTCFWGRSRRTFWSRPALSAERIWKHKKNNLKHVMDASSHLQSNAK